MPSTPDRNKFSGQDPSQFRAGAGGSPPGETPEPAPSIIVGLSPGLGERLPDEFVDEPLAGARTEHEIRWARRSARALDSARRRGTASQLL